MGTGASKDSDEIVYQNEVSMLRNSSAEQQKLRTTSQGEINGAGEDGRQSGMSKTYSQMSQPSVAVKDGISHARATLMNRFIEGYEEANILITKNGFSIQNVVVTEGQVIHDGDKLRPVPGGFGCKQKNSVSGRFEQQFNLEGSYKFAINGIRCTPLSVVISRRHDLHVEVMDEGFKPDVLYTEVGHAIRWVWNATASAHTVKEVKFCVKHGGFLKGDKPAGSKRGTLSGSYRQSFKHSGIYYFETESQNLGKTHLCIVHVKQTPREVRVNVLDRSFDPMILLIEEGDRVWWSWDRENCKKPHSVYQIEQPPLHHNFTDPYQPVKDGFHWSTPSKQGLMSNVFHESGVFHFSDQSFDEAAEYIGTVIVKPRQRDHYVDLTESGFTPDLLYAQTGDRIWFSWLSKELLRSTKTFSVLETDKCISAVSKNTHHECKGDCVFMDKEAAMLVTRMGYSTVQLSSLGVYYYRLSDNPYTASSCSVIVNPGPKNHTVHVTDHGFDPKVLTVRPHDRVWWVWQEGSKQHNIRQVSHHGVPFDDGFNSGAPRDSPSSYMHQFSSPGVFYVSSASLPKMFGAVAVSSQPQVHEIQVNHSELSPDPVIVNSHDIVSWVFRGLRQYDVVPVDSVDKLLDANNLANSIPPRKCLSQSVDKPGVYHFCSRSFQKQRKDSKKVPEIKDDMKLSSVLADDREDGFVISVDTRGFQPARAYVLQGTSILWRWASKEHDSHNIIHVNSCDSHVPLSVIHGDKSFNSGKPVTAGQYQFTFDETGVFTVASQGAPGYSCLIHVVDKAERTTQPFITSSDDGGTVDRYHRVKLSLNDDAGEDVKIYYTTDGSLPVQSSSCTKLYKPGSHVILREPGLRFIRAMAVSDTKLNSDVFTSKRFWVLSSGKADEEGDTDETEETQVRKDSQTDAWLWWECAPTIKGCITAPGIMEVFWDAPSSQCDGLILGYQVFINNASYCDMFPPTNRSLNIVGLAGGRRYEIQVEVYPIDATLSVQRSNKLVMISETSTIEGGPVISLEIGDQVDSLVVVWVAQQTNVTGYQLFLNDHQCGQTLTPDATSTRCKVIIDGCDTMKLYKIYVLAIPKDDLEGRLSNVLEVMLPFDVSAITLPPLWDDGDGDMYKEFIEIREGSGYLPDMDAPLPLQRQTNTNDRYGEMYRFTQSNDANSVADKLIPTVEVHSISDPDLEILRRGSFNNLNQRQNPGFDDDLEQQFYDSERLNEEAGEDIYGGSMGGRVTQEGREYRHPLGSEGDVLDGDGVRLASGSSGEESVEKSGVGEDGREQNRLAMFGTGLLGKAAAKGKKRPVRKIPQQKSDESASKNSTKMSGVASLGKAVSQMKGNIVRRNVSFERGANSDLDDESGLRTVHSGMLRKKPSRSRSDISRRQSSQMEEGDEVSVNKNRINKVASNIITEDTNAVNRSLLSLYGVAQGGKMTGRSKGKIMTTSSENMGDNSIYPESQFERSNNTNGNVNKSLLSLHGVAQIRKMAARSKGEIMSTSSENMGDHSIYAESLDHKRLDNGRYTRDRRLIQKDATSRKIGAVGKVANWAKNELAEKAVEREANRRSQKQAKPRMKTIGVGTRANMSVFTAASCARFAKTPFDRKKIDGGTQTPNAKTHAMSAMSALYFTKRRRTLFSFYEVAKKVLDYVSLEMKLRKAVTPMDRSWTGKTNWTKMRNFFHATNTFRQNQTYEVRARLQETKLRSSRNLLDKLGRVKSRRRMPTSQSMFEVKRQQAWGQDGDREVGVPSSVPPRAVVPRPPKPAGRDLYRAYTGQAYYSNLFDGLVDGHSTNDSEDDESIPLHDGKQEVMRTHLREPTRSYDSSSDSQEDTDEYSDSDATLEDDASGEGTVVFIDAGTPHRATGRKSPQKQHVDDDRDDIESDSNARVEVALENTSVSDHAAMATATPTSAATTRLPPPKRRKRLKKRPSLALVEIDDTVQWNAAKQKLAADDKTAPPREKMIRNDLEGQFIVCEGDGILPPPSIMVESRGSTAVKVQWKLPRQPDPKYRLVVYVVNVVGEKFAADINSDISFDTKFEARAGVVTYGVQHCWNVTGRQKCNVTGLVPGVTYRVNVVANFTLAEGFQPSEMQTSSAVICYTVMGPPDPPLLRVIDVGNCQVTLEWSLVTVHENIHIRGYRIFIDNKPLDDLQPRKVKQLVIDNVTPGKTMTVAVQAISGQPGYDSRPSPPLLITCPARPPAPLINQQPSYKKGCVLVAWNAPQNMERASVQEEISVYSIFVENKWNGEIQANHAANKKGYQFFLTDLTPGQSYDVSVMATSGRKHLEQNPVSCLCQSPLSNIIPVLAPAVPNSPNLRIEAMHSEGVEVMWQTPQQYGDAVISGYQMMRNDKLYGAIIPPDVSCLLIKDVSLGEKITLQLIALTDHPVGKMEITDRDSGIDGSSQPDDREPQFTERYSACRPGSKLTVHYTGLVQPPSRVSCERVTGHSALIVWKRDIHPKAHFVKGDNYQVTWWPGDQAESDINSDTTKDDHLLITGLRPATTYTVVVEARKMQRYNDVDEDSVTAADDASAFILTAKSEHLIVRTASPPDPPRNLGLVATSCTSLKVVWDPPKEHGVEVSDMRVDCVAVDAPQAQHLSQNLIPDTICAQFENLVELTDYLITVTAVTDEYFDSLPPNHRLKKSRKLPPDVKVAPDDSIWLPCSTILVRTSGTTKPMDLTIVKSTVNSVSLTWVPAVAHGSNKLQSTIVRWSEAKPSGDDGDVPVASHVNLSCFDNSFTLEHLEPGSVYKIVVEAVVSVKTSLNPDAASDSSMDKNRRIAHVMSEPIYARTRAPTEPPVVLASSYTRDSVCLYWEKPLLLSVTGKDADDKARYIRRYLDGYKLLINGKCHMIMKPSSQTCTLTKCKPGRTYRINLVAVTCTEDARKRHKKNRLSARKPSSADDEFKDEFDESPSEPIEITVPRNQPGYIASLSAEFRNASDCDSKSFGDISVAWTIQGEANLVRQFSIVWFTEGDRVMQTRFLGPDQRQCMIPASKQKEVYNIIVEPQLHAETISPKHQSIQIQVPGPPDAPEIFLKSVEAEELVVEWGEPRLYGGVRVRGYQVYLNDRLAGNELSVFHHKAVIPIRPNRQYRVNLMALSSNPQFQDSPKSNTLLVGTGPHSGLPHPSPPPHALGDWNPADDHAIPVKVTGVTESAISLDWSGHLEIEDIDCYKVQWSSVAQPAEREVKLGPKDTNCVINKCLPGTTHFVRLVSIGPDGNIVDRSKRLTLQTSAPPSSPVVTLRACNFRYIAIQWAVPTSYGDAHVTGYKVFINNIVEASLNADQMSYTFSHGQACQEYSFQVQALTSNDKLCSAPSEPLVVVWPGVIAPVVTRLPTSNRHVVRVTWNQPIVTEGVRVKHFKVVCKDSGTDEVIQTLGPLHPDTSRAEIKGLKKMPYTILLEVHVYGWNEAAVSLPLFTHPAKALDPPELSVMVVGMEERLQLERVTSSLCNLRDRMIRVVGSELKKIGVNYIGQNQHVIESAQNLAKVEQLLETSFSALAHHTGSADAHLSWVCLQHDPKIEVTGYNILVDGKLYGSCLDTSVRNVRIKLNLDEPAHHLSVVAVCQQPEMTSDESNIVEVLTDLFHPFSFYCYHSVHSRSAPWPKRGCCKYEDSIKYERQRAKKLANQGLLKRQVPPPACNLLDIFDGEYKPLLTHNKLSHPTAILFWTPWCLASQKSINHFVRFAKETSNEYNFIAVLCGQPIVSTVDRQNTVHQIIERGWRDDAAVWHCSSQCSTTISDAYAQIAKTYQGKNAKNSKISRQNRLYESGDDRHVDSQSDASMDLAEMLGIGGVPTFLFIHQDGYIAWHGRYCAFNYQDFTAFMRHTFCEVTATPCTVYNCECCVNNVEINPDIIDILSRYEPAVRSGSPSRAVDIPASVADDTPQKLERLSINIPPTSGIQPGQRASSKKRRSVTQGLKLHHYSVS